MSVYLLRGPSRARMDAVRSTLNAGRLLVRTRFTNATAERSVYEQTTPIRRRPKTKRQVRPSRSGLQAQARVEA